MGALVGAGAGPLAGRITKKVLAGIEERKGWRAATVVETALARITERRATGARPNPLIFDEEDEQADRLLQSTVIAAEQAAEEQKTQLLGNLCAAVLYDERHRVTIDTSMTLINLVRDLTYRQLALIAAIARNTGPKRTAGELSNSSEWVGRSTETRAIAVELDDMLRRSLIQLPPPRPDEIADMPAIRYLPPDRFTLTDLGRVLNDLAGLETIERPVQDSATKWFRNDQPSAPT